MGSKEEIKREIEGKKQELVDLEKDLMAEEEREKRKEKLKKIKSGLGKTLSDEDAGSLSKQVLLTDILELLSGHVYMDGDDFRIPTGLSHLLISDVLYSIKNEKK